MDATRLIRGSRRSLAAAHEDGPAAVLAEVRRCCELVEAVGAGIAGALDGLEFLGGEPPRAGVGAGTSAASAASATFAASPLAATVSPATEAGEPPPADGAWSAGAAAEAARSLAEAAAQVARAVGGPVHEPDHEPDHEPVRESGRPVVGASHGPVLAGPGEAACRLTGVADPPAAVHEMRRLVHETAEALIALACDASDEDLYWRCIDAVDAAAECKSLVTDLLRALGETVPPDRRPETALSLPEPDSEHEPDSEREPEYEAAPESEYEYEPAPEPQP
ncbi:DUF6099 family protein [Phaeacidiphilus oryzae]|uniref:DUF6099 family protein n=1 Tax=Phaeacidiphilus oryzae TaxID=348818 RepID=UPI00068D6A2F|nr:DUF6099 family protein [Phaeacidiphilus oryzae]